MPRSRDVRFAPRVCGVANARRARTAHLDRVRRASRGRFAARQSRPVRCQVRRPTPRRLRRATARARHAGRAVESVLGVALQPRTDGGGLGTLRASRLRVLRSAANARLRLRRRQGSRPGTAYCQHAREIHPCRTACTHAPRPLIPRNKPAAPFGRRDARAVAKGRNNAQRVVARTWFAARRAMYGRPGEQSRRARLRRHAA